MLNPETLAKNIEDRAKKDLAEGNIGGCAVIVKESGKTVYQNCFGVERHGENQPVTEKSLFRLASMTKPITVSCALALMDEGKISLYDPIEKYLPECKDMHLRTPKGDGTYEDHGILETKITVEQLLCHSSGIVGGGMYDMMTDEDRKTRDAAYRYYIRNGVSFVPGTMQEYNSSASFDMMIRIMETVTNEPYESFLKRKLLAPLGMEDTLYIHTDEEAARLTTMWDKKDGKAIHSEPDEKGEIVDYARSVYWGGAGLSSTLSDYIRFAEMLRQNGVYEGNRVLSEEAVKAMSSVHFSPWGLGVRVIEEPYGTLLQGAFGWSGAYGTHFWVDPTADITAVYLKNSRYDGGAGAVTAFHFEQDVYAAMEDI